MYVRLVPMPIESYLYDFKETFFWTNTPSEDTVFLYGLGINRIPGLVTLSRL